MTMLLMLAWIALIVVSYFGAVKVLKRWNLL